MFCQLDLLFFCVLVAVAVAVVVYLRSLTIEASSGTGAITLGFK